MAFRALCLLTCVSGVMSSNTQRSNQQFVQAMQVQHNGRNRRSATLDSSRVNPCTAHADEAECSADSASLCTWTNTKCMQGQTTNGGNSHQCPGEDPKTCHPLCHQVDDCVQDTNECSGCTWCEERCSEFGCPGNKHIEQTLSGGAHNLGFHERGLGDCRCCRHSCTGYTCPSTTHQPKTPAECEATPGENSCYCSSWNCGENAADDTLSCCTEKPQNAQTHVCTCLNGVAAATAGTCLADGPKCVSCTRGYTLNAAQTACVAGSPTGGSLTAGSPTAGSPTPAPPTPESTQTATVTQSSSSSSLADSKKLMRSAVGVAGAKKLAGTQHIPGFD